MNSHPHSAAPGANPKSPKLFDLVSLARIDAPKDAPIHLPYLARVYCIRRVLTAPFPMDGPAPPKKWRQPQLL